MSDTRLDAWHAYRRAANRLEDLQPWERHLVEAQTAKVELLRDIAHGPEWLAIPIEDKTLTTAKQKKKQEAEAYLSTSDPRTGLKSYAERKKIHDANLADSPFIPKGGTVAPTDDEITAARALLTRCAIDVNSQAALDHCLIFQDVGLSNAAKILGASAARYNARNGFDVARKYLQAATLGRHTERGLILYKRTLANLTKFADELVALGGERKTWPAALPSDFEVQT